MLAGKRGGKTNAEKKGGRETATQTGLPPALPHTTTTHMPPNLNIQMSTPPPAFTHNAKKRGFSFIFLPRKCIAPFLLPKTKIYSRPRDPPSLVRVCDSLSLHESFSSNLLSSLSRSLFTLDPPPSPPPPHPSMPLISLLFLGRNFPGGKINRRCFPNWG